MLFFAMTVPPAEPSVRGLGLLAAGLLLFTVLFGVAFLRGVHRMRQRERMAMVKHLRRSDFKS